jgi:hypothetical protein
MTKLVLSTEERSFFSLVRKAVAANPFSEERVALDLKIAGAPRGRRAQKAVAGAIREVGVRIAELKRLKRDDIRLYDGEDRRLIKSTFLFDIFHRFVPAFDQLIRDQLAAGDRSLTVAFAPEVLEFLRRHGFSVSEACRYFELFFQMRRGYFFIQESLVGRSPCMVKLRENLWNNVFTHSIDLYDEHLWNRMEDFSTMMLGPTGAGKGTAAAAIGKSGYIPFDRKKNCFVENFNSAFISINLSQYSETLIESELFGHRKGAFTGAVENYQGVFARCSPYGAILLDEIGEVSRPIQIKLLQLLQERYFLPVGDHKALRFSGRVIAATNRPLEQLRTHGILRDDFFYRLCSDIIVVPGLSERIVEDRAELHDLLAHTIRRIIGKPSPELTEQVHRQILDQLGRDYPWPGNVRELEQCVRRMLISRHYAPFVPPEVRALDGYLQQGMADGTLDAQALVAGYCYLLYQKFGTYEAVAKRAGIDRRTAKKHIDLGGGLMDGARVAGAELDAG